MTERNNDVLEQRPDKWSLLTWVGSAILAYLTLSGALIYWIDFGTYTQYSVLMHTLVGVVSFAPVLWLVLKHWKRRDGTVGGAAESIARLSLPLLVVCLGSGIVITLQAAFGTSVSASAWVVHQVAAAAFAVVLVAHLVPVLLRFARPNPTPRRLARPRFLLIALIVAVVPVTATQWLAGTVRQSEPFRSLPAEYVLVRDEDGPFVPSRARLAGKPADLAVLDPDAVPESATCGDGG